MVGGGKWNDEEQEQWVVVRQHWKVTGADLRTVVVTAEGTVMAAWWLVRVEAKTPKKMEAERKAVVATDPPTVEGWRRAVVTTQKKADSAAMVSWL